VGRGPSADPALGGAGASGDGLRVESTCKDESGVYGILGRNAANDNTGVLGAPGAGVEGRQGRSGLWGALGSASAGARATGTTVVLALVVDGTAVDDHRNSPGSISETPHADEPPTGRTSLAA